MNTAKLHPAQLSTLLSSYEKDTEQILKLSSLLQYLFNFVHPKVSTVEPPNTAAFWTGEKRRVVT